MSSVLIWRSRSWATDRIDGRIKCSRSLDLQRRKPDVQTCCSNVVVRSTDGGLQIRDADDWQYLTSWCSNQSSTVGPSCLVNIGEPSLTVHTEFVEGCATSVILSGQLDWSVSGYTLCVCVSSPAEFQFYTCSAAFLFHLPASLFLLDDQQAAQISLSTALLMLVNGMLYHCQTMMAFSLMQFLSPLTHRSHHCRHSNPSLWSAALSIEWKRPIVIEHFLQPSVGGNVGGLFVCLVHCGKMANRICTGMRFGW